MAATNGHDYDFDGAPPDFTQHASVIEAATNEHEVDQAEMQVNSQMDRLREDNASPPSDETFEVFAERQRQIHGFRGLLRLVVQRREEMRSRASLSAQGQHQGEQEPAYSPEGQSQEMSSVESREPAERASDGPLSPPGANGGLSESPYMRTANGTVLRIDEVLEDPPEGEDGFR